MKARCFSGKKSEKIRKNQKKSEEIRKNQGKSRSRLFLALGSLAIRGPGMNYTMEFSKVRGSQAHVDRGPKIRGQS
jgi:hypothetical protein